MKRNQKGHTRKNIDNFFVDFSSDLDVKLLHIKLEKRKARELRHSNWWQNKLQNPVCYYCNEIVATEQCTMDHLLPLSRGGKSTKSNIVLACKRCNTNKANDTTIERLELFQSNVAH